MNELSWESSPLTQKHAIVLAPMHGFLDASMRAVIAESGGFHFAVSEFIHVRKAVIPASFFQEKIPELVGKKLGREALPLQVQLLGNAPAIMAASAFEACAAGARAIDINLGCPSPTILRHHAGAALLQHPAQIGKIFETIRKTLPPNIPVSAKIRLGWKKTDEVHEIAHVLEESGAQWITIHARTQEELYRPGVHWGPVRKVTQRLSIPIIANGDLFSIADLEKCQRQSGCQHFMLGRGVFQNPLIGQEFSNHLKLKTSPSLITGLEEAMMRLEEIAGPKADNRGTVPARLQQWRNLISSLSK